jgi:hypothetical protein
VVFKEEAEATPLRAYEGGSHRKRVRRLPGKFSVLFSSTSFVGVPFFLQRQFASCFDAAVITAGLARLQAPNITISGRDAWRVE